MVHEDTEDLPSPRAPHLGQWLNNPSEDGGSAVPTASSTPLPSLASISTTDQTLRKISILSNASEPPLCTQPPPPPGGPSEPPGPPVQVDSDSLTSFKTCPSDSNLSGIIGPRLNIADANATYNKSPIPLPVAKPSPRPMTPSPSKSTPAPVAVPNFNPGATPIAAPAPVQTPMPNQPNAITNRPMTPRSENVIGGVRHLVRDARWFDELFILLQWFPARRTGLSVKINDLQPFDEFFFRHDPRHSTLEKKTRKKPTYRTRLNIEWMITWLKMKIMIDVEAAVVWYEVRMSCFIQIRQSRIILYQKRIWNNTRWCLSSIKWWVHNYSTPAK